MDINPVGVNPAKAWEEQPPARDPEEQAPDAAEIDKLSSEIEEERKDLTKLAKEFQQHVAKGEKDKAQLKSAEIQSKQMAVQALQLQVEKLKAPEKDSAKQDPRPKFDRYAPGEGDPAKERSVIYRLEERDGVTAVDFRPYPLEEQAREQME